MSIRTMELRDIIADTRCQSRVELDDALVAEYAEATANGDMFPPLAVMKTEDGVYLFDGFHRYYAAKRAGKTSVRAEVQEGSFRDAILLAAAANSQHGKRRTNGDKRKSVETLLSDPEWSRWTDNEIARRCEVTQPFVSKLRGSHITVISESSTERTYTDRHGNVSTMNTANIGKRVDTSEASRTMTVHVTHTDSESDEVRQVKPSHPAKSPISIPSRPVFIRTDSSDPVEGIVRATGDPNGNIARARLKSAFSTGTHHAQLHLIGLNTDAVADVLSSGDRSLAELFIRDMRNWLDSLERSLNRGVRLLQREGA